MVDEELTSVFKLKGKGVERVKKDNLKWLCENEELQLVWSMICSIDDDDLGEELLKEIAFTWITAWGHSKTHAIKEKYKKAKSTSMKGKHSLHKELKRKIVEGTQSEDTLA